MAYGPPVVSTDCEAGPRELLCAGENVVVVPVADAAALARGLLQAIHVGEAPGAMASQGRHDASAFALERILADWNTCWRREHPLTGGSPDRGP